MNRFPPPLPRSHRAVLVVGIVCLLTSFAGEISEKTAARSADATTRARIAQSFGNLPLSFEINKGQVEQAVKFLSRGPGYVLFLTPAEAVLALHKPRNESQVREGSVLRLKMIGTNSAPGVEGQDELLGKVNYFIGNNPDKWRSDIPTYRKVHYKEIYPGVDMVYYGNQGQLEYDFVVAPGANPKVIKFRVEGPTRIRVDEEGNLQLALNDGEVRLHKPLIYQIAAEGERRDVKGAYVVNGNEISFKVRGFDAKKPLVIDPVLSYSTFLGAGGNENAFGIAVDSQGNAYVTGVTDVGAFPTTPGAFRTTAFGGAFVSKLDSTGSSLVYSTYLSSGNSGSSIGNAIAVDAAGNAHVTGFTTGNDFPTVNALKTTGNFFKTTNAAVSWNNNNIGLTGDVNKVAIAANAPFTLYAGGPTGPHRSTDGGETWIKTANTGLPGFPFPTALAVDPTNSLTVYAGFINGGLFKTTNGGANWTALTIPINGAVVFSIVFDPATPSTMYVGSGNGVFKTTDGGGTWTPLNNFGLPGVPNVRALAIYPSSTTTMYAGTFGSGFFKTTNGGTSWTAMNNGMGGNSPTFINAIAIDPSNSATIYTGHGSSGFSGSINKSTNGAGSWSPVNTGVPNFEVTAIVATTSAVYAATAGGGVIKTTNGGASWSNANSGLWQGNVRTLVVNPFDSTTLFAGSSGSNSSSDAFVTKLNSSGNGLLFSTLLGGSLDEQGHGIAIDGTGNIYVAGRTTSTNFPAVNAIQSAPGATDDCTNGFVSKINPATPAYVFSTYLGGARCDIAFSIAADASGNSYVTGQTSSVDFPTLNAFQANKLGDQFSTDVFVSKLSSTGSLSYSTFIGGNSSDSGLGIAVDASGNAYITGSTQSSNYPTQNPIQPANPADFLGDAFVTKLNSQGSALVYSTYLGGGNADVGRGIAVDANGNAYVAGFTNSLDFPLVAGALHTKSALFKSIDGAANWNNDNYGLGFGVANIAVHPAQTSILYAGTQVGVYKSTNGGRTWTAKNNGLNNSKNIIAIIIDPVTPSTIYAATDAFGASAIYKSTDGGDSWNLRMTGMSNVSLFSLAIDPVTPTTLYAGVAGSPSLFKTTNGADNWAPAGNAPPFFSPVSIAVDPHTPSRLFVAESSSAGGIFRSTDSGSTWESVGLATTGAQGLFVGVSPITANLLYAVTNGGGIFKSVDGGNNWTPLRSGFGRIVFDPVSATTLYFVSSVEGILKSTNGGQTWTTVNKGLTHPVVLGLAIDPVRPSTLYTAVAATNDDDAFVTKINAAGSALIYSTFLGGIPAAGDSLNVNDEAFGIAIDSSGNAYVTGMARSPGFQTTPNSYQPFNRGFSDSFIAKLSPSYIISGQVLELGLTPVFGAEVILNDGTSLTQVITQSDGSYEFSRLREGGSYTVSASKPHFTMTPVSQTFNNLISDQVLNFNALISDSPFYTISGQVTDNGVGLAGVTVTLSGSQTGLRTTDSNGNYSFELIVGGNYTVTPSLLGFTFGPASQTFNGLSSPQTANFTATRQSFVVTNANNHGTGSLREAMTNANATPGLDTIVFNIPGPGVKVINLQVALPEITEAVVIDGSTQPGYAGAPLVEINGSQSSTGGGLVIKAGGTTIRGLAINRFPDIGIFVRLANNNVIQGNYIGLDGNGVGPQFSNRSGILLSESSNNLIGGTTAAARNVISGNGFQGISIVGDNNLVQGNFIGTNPAGTAAIPNGIDGIEVSGTNNLIGGTTPGAGNLISGNQRGLTIRGPGNTVQGNLIGTDVTGTKKVGNLTGVDARAENTLIGGKTPGARNIISGNDSDGLSFGGNGSKLQGNFIGTDITGTLALGNGSSGVVAGDNALIGGTEPEARNIISGNAVTTGFGNISIGSNSSGSGAIVQGNYIGTDVTGTRALANSFAGITISSVNNTIGGTAPGAGNVISGNRTGIQLGGFISINLTGNTIQGNLIGLNALGTAQLPNTQSGIALSDASNNVIGGTQNGAANVIAFNGAPGVVVFSGTGNSIRGNAIFSNNGLGIDLATPAFPQTANGVTPNDPNDPDAGPNSLQNFPVLTSVMSLGNSTTIQGTLNSTPSTAFQIDFYSNAALDPSGNGEGAQFLGTTSVSTDVNGNAAINIILPVALGAGRIVTAAATDPNGNTSEFSTGDATGATGSVQFSVSSIQVIEDVGMATVTVLRTGGSAGTLTVDYATADGTATAGQDYTATSGTLTFNGGETSKTFQIPITDDVPTEPDETFTVTLSNTASLDILGAPSTLLVTVQDRTTVPALFLPDGFVTEGGPGTTTDMLFTLNLTAATGRTVTVNFATSNGTAFGGASCSTRGADYESKSGTFTIQPGTTSLTIPVKICGDTNAEANELLLISLSNPSNASIIQAGAFGTIVNDDVLQLVLEESGPTVTQAAALDALLLRRDPFSIVGVPDWWPNATDKNTRVILFAKNLELNPGESPLAIIVRIIGLNNQVFDVPAESVEPIHNFEFTQVVIRLPNNVPAGTRFVTIRAHGRASNAGTIRVQ